MTPSSILRTLGWSCLLLGWLIPDHVPPWNTFPQEAATNLGVILLWPWCSLRNWPVRIYAAAFLFAAVIAAQYVLFGLERGDLLWGLLVTLFVCMAATLGHQSSLQSSQLRPWFLVLLAAALTNTVIGLAQWLHVTQGLFMLDSPGRVYGNFAQPNHFATLLALGIGALIYLDTQRPLSGVWAHMAALILVIGLVASESRTGALSFTLMVASVAIIGRRKKTVITLRWLIPALLAFWALYAAWDPLSAAMGTSATRNGIGVGTSTRLELWMQMLEAIRLQPWVGYGWLQLGAAQNTVAPYLGGTINMDHAHNLFLDLLVWFGLPLGGMAVWGCMAWGIQMAQHARRQESSSESFCFLLMILPIGIHSMLEYPLAYTYFLIVLAYFAGALEASAGYARVWTRGGWITARAAVLYAIVGSLLLARDYLQIEEDFRALRLEQQFITKQEHLHTFHPPAAWLTQYGALVTALRRDAHAPPESHSVESARSVTLRFPWLMTYQHYYIQLLKNQRCDEARKEWAVIQSLFGKFGILKTEEDIARQGVKDPCKS